VLTVADDLRRHLSHVHNLDVLPYERDLSLQPSLWRIPRLPKNIDRIRSHFVAVADCYLVRGDIPMQPGQRVLGFDHESKMRIRPRDALREHGISERSLGYIPCHPSHQQDQDPALAVEGEDRSCHCLPYGWLVSTRLLLGKEITNSDSVGLTSVFRIVFTYNPTKKGKSAKSYHSSPTDPYQAPSLTASSGSGCSSPPQSFAHASPRSGLCYQPGNSSAL
jgi:hypothetical protein